jgi:hypothetical protein
MLFVGVTEGVTLTEAVTDCVGVTDTEGVTDGVTVTDDEGAGV